MKTQVGRSSPKGARARFQVGPSSSKKGFGGDSRRPELALWKVMRVVGRSLGKGYPRSLYA